MPQLDYSIATYTTSIATAEASYHLHCIRRALRFARGMTIPAGDVSQERGVRDLAREVKRRIVLGTYVLSAGYDEPTLEGAEVSRSVTSDFRYALPKCIDTDSVVRRPSLFSI